MMGPLALTLAFVATAAVYAAAGLGGGSTYLALLTLADLPWTLIPVVALVCNVVVVGQGAVQHSLAGQVPWRRVLPLVGASVPAAFLGSLAPLSERTFFLLVGGALVLAGAAMVAPVATWTREAPERASSSWREAGIGALIGGLAGLTGIGGGIYLSPYLHGTRWAEPHRIAATTTVFILLNSLSGLAGRLSALDTGGELPALVWGLPVAVLVGGLLGSRLSLTRLRGPGLRRVTGLAVATAGLRLLLLEG